MGFPASTRPAERASSRRHARRECRPRASVGLALRNEPASGSGPRLLLKEEPPGGAVPGFLPSAEVGGLGRIVASST